MRRTLSAFVFVVLFAVTAMLLVASITERSLPLLVCAFAVAGGMPWWMNRTYVW